MKHLLTWEISEDGTEVQFMTYDDVSNAVEFFKTQNKNKSMDFKKTR